MKRNIIVGIFFLTLLLYTKGLFDNFDKARKLWIQLSDDVENQITEMSKKVKNKKNQIVIQN